jgi:hypothetical protein
MACQATQFGKGRHAGRLPPLIPVRLFRGGRTVQ